MSAAARIEITPADGLVDQPRRIVAYGFAPVAEVVVQASLAPADGSLWQSRATFVADARGTVSVADTAPIAGDWQEADPAAPVWAMRRTRLPARPELGEDTAPLRIAVSASAADGTVARAEYLLRFVAPGVTRRAVAEDGLSGTLFLPSGAGPHPAVVVLAGSGGGMHEQRAALYAAHGYAALALGYFKAPRRPDHISDTPLEYFEAALRWVRDHLRPANGFIAVSGVSRGGELALLLASRFPELVSAVVAYVPSAVVHGTLRAGRPGQPPDDTAWTWRGEALPNIWRGNPQADWTAFNAAPAPGQAVRQAAAFLSVLRDPAHAAAARIPVERIHGPVLLISGTDDGFWPSTLYCEQIARQLREHGHGWPVEHVVGDAAGHAIGLPQLPATLIAKPHPVAGLVLDGGGTAAANALASARSWTRVRAFLAQAASATAQP